MSNIDSRNDNRHPGETNHSAHSTGEEDNATRRAPGLDATPKDGASSTKSTERKVNDEKKHRLRGAAFDADFDDAEGDSSAVTNRRDNKISDS